MSDGVYNSSVTDSQIGGMAILKCIMQLDPTARFNATPPAVVPIVVPKEVPKEVKTAAGVAGPLIVLATYLQEHVWWIVLFGVLLTVVIIAAMHVVAATAPQLSPKAIDEVPPVPVPPEVPPPVPPVVEVPPNATV